MSQYSESQLDRDNLKWFNDSRKFIILKSITISGTNLRGLHPCTLKFEYPITAIVGTNGSGKSTLLALVTCAFHNDGPFCPSNLLGYTGKSARVYYTMSDFFVFTKQEAGLTHGIEITSIYSDGLNEGTKSVRRKKPSGKWRDYNTRPKRVVSFLGLNRVLPPTESMTHRNYRKLFVPTNLSYSQKSELAECMTEVFNRSYSNIELDAHKQYRLYECSTSSATYSGFNMGAGENAALRLLYEVIAAGVDALIVVDEIELGLHSQAQMKLITVLKKLCKKYHSQIVCSTHSATILSKIPPCGRALIHSTDAKTDILYGISEELAISELSGCSVAEKEIFVEDEVAKSFIENSLSADLRKRISIKIMGSATGSLLQSVCVHIRENRLNFLAIFDGDQRDQKDNLVKLIVENLSDYQGMSDKNIRELLDKQMFFLPGNVWPEKSILEKLKQNAIFDYLRTTWGMNRDDEIIQLLNKALAEGKHNEFYRLSEELSLPLSDVQQAVMKQYNRCFPESIADIANAINPAINFHTTTE